MATSTWGLERKERKKQRVFIWRFFWPRWYTQSAQAWITQFYRQITPCLPFLRQRSPDVTTTATEAADISLLIYQPRKDERLSWPSWLTYSGWFTHISGHPSVIGRAQDSESTPAKDRCSTAGPRNSSESAKLCGVDQRAPPIFGRAAITLGHILVIFCSSKLDDFLSDRL